MQDRLRAFVERDHHDRLDGGAGKREHGAEERAEGRVVGQEIARAQTAVSARDPLKGEPEDEQRRHRRKSRIENGEDVLDAPHAKIQAGFLREFLRPHRKGLRGRAGDPELRHAGDELIDDSADRAFELLGDAGEPKGPEIDRDRDEQGREAEADREERELPAVAEEDEKIEEGGDRAEQGGDADARNDLPDGVDAHGAARKIADAVAAKEGRRQAKQAVDYARLHVAVGLRLDPQQKEALDEAEGGGPDRGDDHAGPQLPELVGKTAGNRVVEDELRGERGHQAEQAHEARHRQNENRIPPVRTQREGADLPPGDRVLRKRAIERVGGRSERRGEVRVHAAGPTAREDGGEEEQYKR